MKTRVYFFTIILFFSTNIYSHNLSSTSDSISSDSVVVNQIYFSLLYSPSMNMRSGAETILSVHKGITALEDNYIGIRWFSESNMLGKMGGISVRLAKYALLDVPIDYFSIVLSHEYFGHGSHYREFDVGNIHYSFSAPPPYGKGGGEATYYGAAQISYYQLLTIWAGGVEIHPLINKSLSLRWIAKNEMNYREASQYFWSFQIKWTYILDTNEDIFDGTSDNDIRAYIRFINSQSVYTDPEVMKMSIRDLKSKMILNAVNPFVFYSLYSFFKTYLWDGDKSNKVPTINFGEIKYLPSFRAGLTPFGIEYHLDNYFRYKEKISLINLRYGDRTFYDFWGGIGLFVQNIYSPQNFSFDINLNLWNQPGLKFGNDQAEIKGEGIGGAFSIRGYIDVPNKTFPISAVVELGYKSVGFLEGYALDSSPIFALGIAIRN
jgi:hypothetical protein